MNNYILIVEDDNDISHMLKELLQQNGYETAQAFSGTELRKNWIKNCCNIRKVWYNVIK